MQLKYCILRYCLRNILSLTMSFYVQKEVLFSCTRTKIFLSETAKEKNNFSDEIHINFVYEISRSFC